MYLCDRAIVLKRIDVNDYDVITTVFSREYGRFDVSFKSAKKSVAKLRALTEVFCYSDFRLYMRRYGSNMLCIGGKIISAFPRLRNNFNNLMISSFISDVFLSLVPPYQKSYEKFDMLLYCFDYLDKNENISKWFIVWFLANLLEHFGCGFANTSLGYDSRFWSALHRKDFDYKILWIYDDLYYDVLEFLISKVDEHSNKSINRKVFDYILEKNL